jgi:flotillin
MLVPKETFYRDANVVIPAQIAKQKAIIDAQAKAENKVAKGKLMHIFKKWKLKQRSI